jgi:DNA mismatch repair protein MutL
MAPPEASTQTAEHYLPQLSDYRLIGQFVQTYILLETPEGLLVVDQHIAAERVYFEQFWEQAQRAEPASQVLLLPLTFAISPVQASVLEEQHDAFAKLGFAYTVTDAEVAFQAVPSLYNEKVLKTSLEALLAHLEETGEVKLAFDDVIATAACHSAVRAGDPLSHEQMQRILTQWSACTRPWTCPHGRPVSHLIPHQDIMRFFERPSLPGGRHLRQPV